RVEVVGDIEVCGREHGSRGAAGKPALHLAPRGRTAGEPVDDLARGDAQRQLVVAGALHVAGDRYDLGAGRGLDPELRIALAAHADDRGHGRERLDVVDQGGALVEALDRGEGRLQARIAALAFQRVE